jgi:heme oxygenase (biliverdin-IX-beta and delta-forming)
MLLSEQLKDATKTNHQLLEKKLITHLKAVRTPADYATILTLFYGFFGGMETPINEHLDMASLPDYPQRRKAAALAYDLGSLHAALPPLATGTDVPTIGNHLQALGALYVMEGSTLGGKIISKMMKAQLNQAAGMTFFEGYGNATDAMWQTFRAVLDQPLSQIEKETVVQAADETFIKFRHWFDRHL